MKYLLILVPLVLGGCQLPAKPSKSTINTQSASQIQVVQTQQQQLAMEGKFNQVTSSLTGTIRTNSDRISVNWDGDAFELLSQLARQRGLVLRHTGVRLPLPLNLHIHNVTFETLLRLVKTQIDWRAQLTQQADALELFYMPPLKRGLL